MKTMTIRDVKQRWPETERALAVERLLPNGGGAPERKRFDPEKQAQWREETFGKGL